jgi:dihydroorotate dehydrogenase electron transfer subunit
VTALCTQDLARAGLAGPYQVLACGPTPMLRAAAALAAQRGWSCLVSVEEHMGCGYGVCKGCVVPVWNGEGGVRNAMSCEEGPVFDAAGLAWDSFQCAPAGAGEERA